MQGYRGGVNCSRMVTSRELPSCSVCVPSLSFQSYSVCLTHSGQPLGQGVPTSY